MKLNSVRNYRFLFACLCASASAPLAAQSTPAPQSVNTTATPGKPLEPPTLPKDYVIGAEDVLNIVFWNAKELSAEVLVRPDGKISLPILNDVPAAGMTPEQLAESIAKIGTKFVRDAGATVIVKAVNSRKVYIIGEVARPGSFTLGSELNVMQAIGGAGGFLEGAKKGDVVIVRNENGKERRYKFDYNDVVEGKNLEQNIRLLPGDTILVR